MTQQLQEDGTRLFLASLGRSYNLGWIGPAGVVEGLRTVHNDWEKTVTFLVADHHTSGDEIYHRAVIGIAVINNEPRWRWCGENDDPHGAGSRTFCEHDLEEFELAIATVMAELAYIKGRHPESTIYRERLIPDEN